MKILGKVIVVMFLIGIMVSLSSVYAISPNSITPTTISPSDVQPSYNTGSIVGIENRIYSLLGTVAVIVLVLYAFFTVWI